MEQLNINSEFVQKHRDEDLIKYLYTTMNAIYNDATSVRRGENVNLLISDYGKIETVTKILKEMNSRNAEKLRLAQTK